MIDDLQVAIELTIAGSWRLVSSNPRGIETMTMNRDVLADAAVGRS